MIMISVYMLVFSITIAFALLKDISLAGKLQQNSHQLELALAHAQSGQYKKVRKGVMES